MRSAISEAAICAHYACQASCCGAGDTGGAAVTWGGHCQPGQGTHVRGGGVQPAGTAPNPRFRQRCAGVLPSPKPLGRLPPPSMQSTAPHGACRVRARLGVVVALGAWSGAFLAQQLADVRWAGAFRPRRGLLLEMPTPPGMPAVSHGLMEVSYTSHYSPTAGSSGTGSAVSSSSSSSFFPLTYEAVAERQAAALVASKAGAAPAAAAEGTAAEAKEAHEEDGVDITFTATTSASGSLLVGSSRWDVYMLALCQDWKEKQVSPARCTPGAQGWGDPASCTCQPSAWCSLPFCNSQPVQCACNCAVLDLPLPRAPKNAHLTTRSNHATIPAALITAAAPPVISPFLPREFVGFSQDAPEHIVSAIMERAAHFLPALAAVERQDIGVRAGPRPFATVGVGDGPRGGGPAGGCRPRGQRADPGARDC